MGYKVENATEIMKNQLSQVDNFVTLSKKVGLNQNT